MDKESYMSKTRVLEQQSSLYSREQAGQGNNLHYLGRRRLPFIVGSDIRLAHQLLGKPEAEMGGGGGQAGRQSLIKPYNGED